MTRPHALLEGITHLEDLDLQAFIAAVKNISKMQASEKLDGANLWFGLDDEGRLYTSRAGKRRAAENMYEEKDYPYFAAYNGFRSAHAALKQKEREIKAVLRAGDTIEIEVLFGRQPNAVTYGAGGKNYIAFLRGVEGTPDTMVDLLSTQLSNSSVSVKVDLVDSVDGVNLTLQPADVQFQFVGAQKIDTAKLKDTDVAKHLAALEKFLSQQAALPKGAPHPESMTNFDLLTRTLGSIPQAIRPMAKELKAQLMAKVMADFKLPIKKELLDKFVNQIKSPLAGDDLTPDEDIGIEGVVLKDPTTGEQIKLVDKDTFTTVNQFNHAVRNSLSGTIKTTDSNASIESRGGLVGNMYITIADLLGNIGLSRGVSARKVMQTVKGKDPEATIRNLAKELGSDDYLGTKRKVLALIEETQAQLAGALTDFKKHKDSFRLKLKSGKTIGLSPEIIRRTLVSFAETKRNIDELLEKVKGTKTLAQLLAILYGRHAKAVFATGDEEPVAESLLKDAEEAYLIEKRHTTDKALYHGKDAFHLLNTYMATVAMSTIIYKAKDKLGIKLLRDKTHMRLNSWSPEMSPLNFWGYVIWRSGTPAVKKLLGKQAAEIFRFARRCPPAWWKFLHIDLSFGAERPADWVQNRKAITFLQAFPGLNIDRLNSILDGAFNYDELTLDQKVKLHSKLYYYAQQFVGSSPLLYRMRAISDELLLNANDENYQMVEGMKLLQSITALKEDDAPSLGAGGAALPSGSGAAAGAVGGMSAATSAGDIASYPKPLFGQKQIIRRKRNPEVKRLKFPRPEETKK